MSTAGDGVDPIDYLVVNPILDLDPQTRGAFGTDALGAAEDQLGIAFKQLGLGLRKNERELVIAAHNNIIAVIGDLAVLANWLRPVMSP